MIEAAPCPIVRRAAALAGRDRDRDRETGCGALGQAIVAFPLADQSPEVLMETSKDTPTDAALLVARLCLATVFVSSAMDKFRAPAKELEQIGALKLPGSPKTLATLAGSCEMIGAASLTAGLFSRTSAVLLAGFLGAVSIKELNFWSAKGPPEAVAGQKDAFVANVAIIGGLIYAATKGPGRLALGGPRSN